MGILCIQQVLNLTIEPASNYMVAAIKLFEENSIGISQKAVKAYLGMKTDVRLRKVDNIDG